MVIKYIINILLIIFAVLLFNNGFVLTSYAVTFTAAFLFIYLLSKDKHV